MKEKQSTISLEKIYNQFVLFFCGTIAVTILYFFGNTIAQDPNLNYLPYILTNISFICYFYNFVSFVIYYVTKFSKVAGENYQKHRSYYWGGALFVLLAILLICGYYMLGIEELVKNILTTGLMTLFGLIIWWFKYSYKKKFKKK